MWHKELTKHQERYQVVVLLLEEKDIDRLTENINILSPINSEKEEYARIWRTVKFVDKTYVIPYNYFKKIKRTFIIEQKENVSVEQDSDDDDSHNKDKKEYFVNKIAQNDDIVTLIYEDEDHIKVTGYVRSKENREVSLGNDGCDEIKLVTIWGDTLDSKYSHFFQNIPQDERHEWFVILSAFMSVTSVMSVSFY